MPDDVDATLAKLEQRLRALQVELDEDGVEVSRAAPEPSPEHPPLRPTPLAEPLDPLERFGAELRRLVELWERTVAELRGESALFSGDVAVEARADLTGLCDLERALRAVPGVAGVTLRAYAAGHAALEVRLDREVALIAALRRSLRFSVEEATSNLLAIAVLG